ncbi:MAG: MipA/OmpV family protein [Deltaproteobacteria bacterium]|jgi:outer membrane protein|nr:MipA/OmpV family protein [Deltaproteobacteria bacterium]
MSLNIALNPISKKRIEVMIQLIRRSAVLISFLALVFFLPVVALAQPEDDIDDTITPLTGSIGLGIVYTPDYDGAKTSKVRPFPYFNLLYGPVFLSTERGLGVKFDLLDGNLQLAPAINYRWEREQDDSPILNGMGDISGTFTLGGTISYYFAPFVLQMKAFQSLSSDKGFTMDFRAGYFNRDYEKLHWGISLTSSLADQNYNQTYFGVTQEQSTNSGHPVYTPSAGFKDVGLRGAVDYFLTTDISVDVFANYHRLISEAGKSPLVKSGTPDQFSTGLLFFFHFGGY